MPPFRNPHGGIGPLVPLSHPTSESRRGSEHQEAILEAIDQGI